MWINDGKIEKIIKDDNIPDGFVKGRLPRSEESKHKQSQTMKGHKGYWAGKKMPKTTAGETLHRQFESGERVQWNKGLSGDPRCKGHEPGTPPYNKGMPLSEEQKVKIVKSIYRTKLKNNSFHISKKEDEYYEFLKTIYKDNDIIRQYKDERYPFACDFYIKSEDKFIELNLTWTHGGRQFDNNDEFCLAQLEKWKEKANKSRYYKNAIYTWTDLDVRKLDIAKKNNLNYEVIYKWK